MIKPTGLGMWIWELKNCDGGNLTQIMARARAANLSWVAVKGADGEYLWKNQFTPTLIRAFHDAGITCYGWGYAYGYRKEADVAIWCLDQGADGYIIDAEAEYEHLPNNARVAEQYISAIRHAHPDTMLSHAPFPIISYHRRFPYNIFNTLTDFSMPQCYWQDIGISVDKMVSWYRQEWRGIPNVIPVAQGYNVSELDLARFVSLTLEVSSSVSVWDYQHLTAERWQALGSVRRTTSPVTPSLPIQRKKIQMSDCTAAYGDFKLAQEPETPNTYEYKAWVDAQTPDRAYILFSNPSKQTRTARYHLWDSALGKLAYHNLEVVLGPKETREEPWARTNRGWPVFVCDGRLDISWAIEFDTKQTVLVS